MSNRLSVEEETLLAQVWVTVHEEPAIHNAIIGKASNMFKLGRFWEPTPDRPNKSIKSYLSFVLYVFFVSYLLFVLYVLFLYRNVFLRKLIYLKETYLTEILKHYKYP